jgi:DHA1 family tetracycline resistance protein-like MFS transporter
MALDYVLMSFAPTLAWLFVGRMIHGISASTYGIANAFIADTFPAEQRAKNFALIGAAFGLGFILGPMIGGLLGEYGPRVPFLAAAGLTFLNVAYGWFVLPESLKPENRRKFELARANPAGAFNQLWRHPVVFGLAFAYFLYMLGHHALPTIWSYFAMEKFDWSPSQIGFSLGVVGVRMIFVQVVAIRWMLERHGPERTACVRLVLTAVSFLGYAFSPYGWMMYVAIMVGAFQGFVGPSIQGLMTSRVPANAQGELQGAIGSLSSLVSILSPPFMAQLFGWFTSADAPVYFPGAPFLAAAVLTLLGLGMLVATLVGQAKVSAGRT